MILQTNIRVAFWKSEEDRGHIILLVLSEQHNFENSTEQPNKASRGRWHRLQQWWMVTNIRLEEKHHNM